MGRPCRDAGRRLRPRDPGAVPHRDRSPRVGHHRQEGHRRPPKPAALPAQAGPVQMQKSPTPAGQPTDAPADSLADARGLKPSAADPYDAAPASPAAPAPFDDDQTVGLREAHERHLIEPTVSAPRGSYTHIQRFNHTGSVENFIVPPGVTTIDARCCGGGAPERPRAAGAVSPPGRSPLCWGRRCGSWSTWGRPVRWGRHERAVSQRPGQTLLIAGGGGGGVAHDRAPDARGGAGGGTGGADARGQSWRNWTVLASPTRAGCGPRSRRRLPASTSGRSKPPPGAPTRTAARALRVRADVLGDQVVQRGRRRSWPTIAAASPITLTRPPLGRFCFSRRHRRSEAHAVY